MEWIFFMVMNAKIGGKQTFRQNICFFAKVCYICFCISPYHTGNLTSCFQRHTFVNFFLKKLALRETFGRHSRKQCSFGSDHWFFDSGTNAFPLADYKKSTTSG